MQLWESDYGLPRNIEPIPHVNTSNLEVATASELPSGSDLINGIVRKVTDEDKIYAYNEEEAAFLTHKFSSINTFLTETDLEEGADQLLGAAPIFSVPRKEAGVDSVRVRYWLLNGFSEQDNPVISAGQSFNFIIYVNGESYTDSEGKTIWFNQVFDGLIKFELVGYYRYLNAAFDNSIDSAGIEQIWSPSSIPKSILTLPQDLPAGWAAVVDVWLSFDEITRANRGIQETDFIGIEFDRPRKFSAPSPLTNALGNNTIFGTDDRALVLPNKIFAGKGVINGRDVSVEEQVLEGISQDTDNQLVVINSLDGSVRVVQPAEEIFNEEIVRASISTSPGRTNPSEVSNSVTLTAGQSLSVTIAHPVIGNRATVRGDYPDPLIVGSTLAFWDNPEMRLAIAHDGTLYEANYLVSADTISSQTIEISSLDDFVEVGFLPEVASDFGLFKPQAPTISDNSERSQKLIESWNTQKCEMKMLIY